MKHNANNQAITGKSKPPSNVKPFKPPENKTQWEIELENHVNKFNNKFVQVMFGGKHRIGEIKKDGICWYSLKEISLCYDNQPIKVDVKKTGGVEVDVYKNLIKAWATHPLSREQTYLGGTCFLPGHEAPRDKFNTWRGFSVKPSENTKLLEKIYVHIKEIVCVGNEVLFDYFLNWIAYSFQHPDRPAGSALVLRGEKGSGKGTLGQLLKSIWGCHGLQISNPRHLVGNFNGHLADVCFLFADEAFYSGDRAHECVLKALITEPHMIIERKGLDAISQPNYLKVFMATNADFAVPASRDERRYCVFDVASSKIGDTRYFKILHQACESTHVQASFLFAMLNRDIKNFHPGAIPETKGLREQRYHSMTHMQKWVIDCLIKGTFGIVDYNGRCDEWRQEIPTEDLYRKFKEYLDAAKVGEFRRATETELGRYLSKIYGKVRRVDNTSKRGYFFGSLDYAVKKFEDYEKVKLSELGLF